MNVSHTTSQALFDPRHFFSIIRYYPFNRISEARIRAGVLVSIASIKALGPPGTDERTLSCSAVSFVEAIGEDKAQGCSTGSFSLTSSKALFSDSQALQNSMALSTFEN